MGSNDGSSVALNTDTPIRCSYTFGEVLPEVRLIRLFKFPYNAYNEARSVDFRDLSVDWQ